MKCCARCGEAKPLLEFYRSKASPDGHAHYCKPCQIAYGYAYYRLPGVKERGNARRNARRRQQGRHENPAARRAQSAARVAIAAGKLTRQPCSACGAEPGHAHHEDYTKPLDVTWLCDPCHRRLHRERRWAEAK